MASLSLRKRARPARRNRGKNMIKKYNKAAARAKRQTRVRGKISGTPERPRLNVFRSSSHMYAQIIDDVNGVTLASASTCNKEFKDFGGNVAAAEKVGEAVAKAALDKGISNVVFDRAGYLYHGRVKAVADGARKAGLSL